jgi:hypothetical protein
MCVGEQRANLSADQGRGYVRLLLKLTCLSCVLYDSARISLELCNTQAIPVNHSPSNNHDAAGIAAETEMACGQTVVADSPAAAQKEKFRNSAFSFEKISLHPAKICRPLSAIRHLLSDNRYLCTLY